MSAKENTILYDTRSFNNMTYEEDKTLKKRQEDSKRNDIRRWTKDVVPDENVLLIEVEEVVKF